MRRHTNVTRDSHTPVTVPRPDPTHKEPKPSPAYVTGGRRSLGFGDETR